MTLAGLDWIAVDWGTSNMRAWAMGAGGAILAQGASDKGMGKLAPDGFEPALLEVIGDWIGGGPATVVACGMVGARQGWTEARYGTVPCPPLPPGFTAAPVRREGLAVHIIPGLCQTAPADVMRGEETQIAGFLSLHPGWDGVLCLPGTHTKWVEVSAGEVTSFLTVMTGELFATLTTQTVLRHSTGGEGWDEAAFDAALTDGMDRPDRLVARLFSLRAESLLAGLTADRARARLSGLLLGAELSAARPWWLGRQIGIIGAGRLARLYARALAAQGAPSSVADNDTVTLAGLSAARAQLKG